MERSLKEITLEIRADWKNPYFGAMPYLNAMALINSVDDKFFADNGREVVIYFLANASTWRGEVARRVKKELNQLVKP